MSLSPLLMQAIRLYGPFNKLFTKVRRARELVDLIDAAAASQDAANTEKLIVDFFAASLEAPHHRNAMTPVWYVCTGFVGYNRVVFKTERSLADATHRMSEGDDPFELTNIDFGEGEKMLPDARAMQDLVDYIHKIGQYDFTNADARHIVRATITAVDNLRGELFNSQQAMQAVVTGNVELALRYDSRLTGLARVVNSVATDFQDQPGQDFYDLFNRYVQNEKRAAAERQKSKDEAVVTAILGDSSGRMDYDRGRDDDDEDDVAGASVVLISNVRELYNKNEQLQTEMQELEENYKKTANEYRVFMKNVTLDESLTPQVSIAYVRHFSSIVNAYDAGRNPWQAVTLLVKILNGSNEPFATYKLMSDRMVNAHTKLFTIFEDFEKANVDAAVYVEQRTVGLFFATQLNANTVNVKTLADEMSMIMQDIQTDAGSSYPDVKKASFALVDTLLTIATPTNPIVNPQSWRGVLDASVTYWKVKASAVDNVELKQTQFYTQLETKNQELQIKINTLENKLKTVATEKSTLQKNVESLKPYQAYYKELLSKQDTTATELGTMEKELTRLNSKLEELQNENENLQRERSELEGDRTKMRLDLENIQLEKSALLARIEEMRITVTQHKDSAAAHKKEAEASKLLYDELLASRDKTIRDALAEAKGQNKILKDSYDETMKSLRDYKANEDAFKKEVARLQEENATLSTQLTAAQSANETTKTQLHVLQETQKTLRSDKDTAEAHVVEQLKTIGQQVSRIRKLETDVADLEAQVQAAIDELAEEIDKTQALKDQLEEAEKDKESLTRQLSDANEQLDAIRKRTHASQSTLDKSLSQVTTERDQAAHQLAAEKQRVRELREELARVTQSKNEAQESATALDGQLKSAKRDLKSARDTLQAERTKWAEGESTLQSQLHAAKEELQRARSEAKNLQAALDAELQTSAEKDVELRTAREERNVARKDEKQAAASATALNAKLIQMQSALDSKERKVQQLNDMVETLQSDLTAANQKRDGYEKEIDNLNSTIRTLQESKQAGAGHEDRVLANLKKHVKKLREERKKSDAEYDKRLSESSAKIKELVETSAREQQASLKQVEDVNLQLQGVMDQLSLVNRSYEEDRKKWTAWMEKASKEYANLHESWSAQKKELDDVTNHTIQMSKEQADLSARLNHSETSNSELKYALEAERAKSADLEKKWKYWQRQSQVLVTEGQAASTERQQLHQLQQELFAKSNDLAKMDEQLRQVNEKNISLTTTVTNMINDKNAQISRLQAELDEASKRAAAGAKATALSQVTFPPKNKDKDDDDGGAAGGEAAAAAPPPAPSPAPCPPPIIDPANYPSKILMSTKETGSIDLAFGLSKQKLRELFPGTPVEELEDPYAVLRMLHSAMKGEKRRKNAEGYTVTFSGPENRRKIVPTSAMASARWPNAVMPKYKMMQYEIAPKIDFASEPPPRISSTVADDDVNDVNMAVPVDPSNQQQQMAVDEGQQQWQEDFDDYLGEFIPEPEEDDDGQLDEVLRQYALFPDTQPASSSVTSQGVPPS